VAKRRGADALAAALAAEGVKRVFTLSGNHIMPAFDALLDSGIELIHVRHEASAVHMADAYARLTGEVGVAMVTGGPGHANAVSALYTAAMAESPVVLLSGHAPHDELGRGAFQEMRASAFILPARDTAIAGQAKALLDWHKRHGFCANCGTGTESQDGGYRRTCPHCGAEHFPRTDPVVIMLPIFKHGDGREECLVGRNKRFPPLLYSAFAGFVEPGESMEEAVRRELREEVNLEVGTVTYHATQPWPFPSSLMLGCYAQMLRREFAIDGHEIEAARWLSKDEARARLANTIEDEMKLPVTIAIAHYLIRDWAQR